MANWLQHYPALPMHEAQQLNFSTMRFKLDETYVTKMSLEHMSINVVHHSVHSWISIKKHA